jgi:tRNA A-37 threonylcarbamoyl transferase component Bud32/tetratricopeptide (TPR) repeat protein
VAPLGPARDHKAGTDRYNPMATAGIPSMFDARVAQRSRQGGCRGASQTGVRPLSGVCSPVMGEATQPLVYRCTICHAVYSAAERFCPLDAGPIKPEDQHSDPRIGKTIDGRYFIRRLIGRGGMGAVYEADHVGLDKRVAVKFLSINKTDRDALARFRREAKIASRIVHEHVVHIYDVGTADADTDFIVMEFLEGRDLAVTLREGGALDGTRTVSIIRKVLRGLRAIHQAGIVHRDIKPANILLSPREEDRDFVKIMDFGISKPIVGETITNTGAIIGTPEYMSPEQLLGDDIDPRADLYAVGIMTYRMITGRLPFTTDTFDRSAAANPYVPVPSLRDSHTELPRELINAIEKATAKDRDARFADAQAFLAALEEIPAASMAVKEATARTVSSRMSALAAADTAIADSAPATPATQQGWSPPTAPAARTTGASEAVVQAAATIQTAPRSRTGIWIALALLMVGAAVTTVLALRKGEPDKVVVVEPPPAPTAPAGGPPPAVRPSDKDKVTAALQKAREADAKGDLAEALTAYQAAYAIDPSPDTIYAIAELHERLGHKEDAVRFFERYLMAAKDAPNRDSVTKKIAQLQNTQKPGSGVTHPAHASGVPTVVKKDLQPCHCIPKDRRDTVSMCAKKGPSMCRCSVSTGGSLCPVPVVQCPECPDGTRNCWSKNCNSSGFECPDANYNKQRKPGKHDAACTGFEDWRIGAPVDGKLDCDHCDDVPEPRQFKGHEGDSCVGYYRPTGEKLDGWLICY